MRCFLSAPGAIAADQGQLPGRQRPASWTQRRMALLAHESWMQRNAPEGHEGTAAFRDKRRPDWYVPAPPQQA